ncbi:MAG: 50S ribosomal protein L15 [Longimicrobiales bacterium]
MDLSKLRAPDGATHSKKRLGRGPGSGTGKTSGRGHKGQKARTGHHGTPAWFEGGQMPLQRRLPKRGFNNKPFRTEYETVNLRELERLEADTIGPAELAGHRLVRRGRLVKILGDGDVARKLTLRAHAFTKSARQKIEAAGGTVEVIEARAGAGAGAGERPGASSDPTTGTTDEAGAGAGERPAAAPAKRKRASRKTSAGGEA